MLTQATIRDLYPRAEDAHLLAFANRAEELFDRFRISANSLRLHFFLAQIGHESGGLTIMAENLNYRAERLVAVWPKRFPTVDSARPFAGNPQGLANKVYAKRMGNGPESSGDGWRYRGRGYIQTHGTGRLPASRQTCRPRSDRPSRTGYYAGSRPSRRLRVLAMEGTQRSSAIPAIS